MFVSCSYSNKWLQTHNPKQWKFILLCSGRVKLRADLCSSRYIGRSCFFFSQLLGVFGVPWHCNLYFHFLRIFSCISPSTSLCYGQLLLAFTVFPILCKGPFPQIRSHTQVPGIRTQSSLFEVSILPLLLFSYTSFADCFLRYTLFEVNLASVQAAAMVDTGDPIWQWLTSGWSPRLGNLLTWNGFRLWSCERNRETWVSSQTCGERQALLNYGSWISYSWADWEIQIGFVFFSSVFQTLIKVIANI